LEKSGNSRKGEQGEPDPSGKSLFATLSGEGGRRGRGHHESLSVDSLGGAKGKKEWNTV